MSVVGIRPGVVRARGDVPAPLAYAVFDCETTGTNPSRDEIVSLAVVRLDADGVEQRRYARLVRPSRPIPPEATAVHGIADRDVAAAPRLRTSRPRSSRCSTERCSSRTTSASTWRCSSTRSRVRGSTTGPLPLPARSRRSGSLEPLADNHRLQSICERHGIALEGPHEATSDVLATASLLRLLLDDGLAPETIELDEAAYHTAPRSW